MPAVSIATPFNISLEFSTASVWKRLLAFVIDAVIIFLYEKACSMIIGPSLPYSGAARIFIILLVFLLPVLFYHFLMEVFFNGQSIGKRALGIRVVNIMGNASSASQSLIRMLFRSHMIAPLLAMIIVAMFTEVSGTPFTESMMIAGVLIYMLLSLGLVLFYFMNKYNQRLGDWLADTLVIENKAQADITKTIYQELHEEHYTVLYPEVMRLTDRDINGIRNLLRDRRPNKDALAYQERIAMRIEEVLGISRQAFDAADFLEQLLRDYNYLTRK